MAPEEDELISEENMHTLSARYLSLSLSGK
jgi:hypothetical protein